jgi:hypothetical protein
MPVSAITGQAPALQQQLIRAGCRLNQRTDVMPEAVAVELVPAWRLFGVCAAPLTANALTSLVPNVLAERPGLMT